MGAVRVVVGAPTFHEFPGERGGPPVSTDGLETDRGHGGDGDDAAVAPPVGVQGAVDEEAVAGGVAAFAVAPGGARQSGAVEVAGGLVRNPPRSVKPPRVEAEPMRFLSHDEVAAMAAAIDTRSRTLVLLAGYSGLRAGELAALRRKHVDLLHRTVTVVEQVQRIGGRFGVLPPKSAAGRRSVAMPTLVADALQDHLAYCGEPAPEGLVFPAPEGGFLRPENFRNRSWLPAVKAAGIAPLRLHDLRHTCASLTIAAGADVKILQRILGHASAPRSRPPPPGDLGRLADRPLFAGCRTVVPGDENPGVGGTHGAVADGGGLVAAEAREVSIGVWNGRRHSHEFVTVLPGKMKQAVAFSDRVMGRKPRHAGRR